LCCCVQVYGSAPTAHGLISEAFLGTAEPDTAAAAAAAVVPGVDNLAAGLDMVARWVDTGGGVYDGAAVAGWTCSRCSSCDG
jgi:hypothetical protein